MRRDGLLSLFLAGISGVLGFLAFPPFGYGLLAWVGFLPLFFAIRRSTVRGAFWLSYFSGVVFFGGLLFWLTNVTVPGTVILVLILSVFYGLFGLFAGILFKYSLELLILPFVWVVLEYLRGYMLTGFPWGILGYTQYRNLNIIQIADVAGGYGISFILVLVNVAFFSHLVRAKRRIAYMVAALAMIVVAVTYGVCRLNNFKFRGEPVLSVIQGNIPQEIKWDGTRAGGIIGEYDDLTRKAAGDRPDMVIWPETAYPYLVNAGDEADEVKEIAEEIGVPVLTGVVYRDGKDFFNCAALFSEKEELVRKYYKIHLVPFGEFIPLEKYLSPLKKYINKPIGDYAKGGEYTLFPLRSLSLFRGEDGSIARSADLYRFGVLICFEDVFPYIAREFVLKGADLMVNMTNDAWFGDTAAAEQHLQASVFRAVENRVPVIRAANTGVSCFVDSTGEVLSRVEEGGKDTFVRGFRTASVRVCGIRSFYTRNGDVFVYFCGLIVALFFAVELFRGRGSP